MKIAVVGATGMVGQEMLKVLEEQNLEIDTLIPVASEKSVGKTISFKGKDVSIVGMHEAIESSCDYAIFSAGGDTSLKFAPEFAAKGTVVVDNSSAWRMHQDVPLVVPEINLDSIKTEHKIIANPNCSTIQLVMTLAPLHRAYGVRRVVVSTYQSITGTGVKAVKQMEDERGNIEGDKAYAYSIDRNCIPQCDVFLENDYTKEEMKLTNETKKIVDEGINVVATAVRVPVVGGHSESVNIQFDRDFDIAEVKSLLAQTKGIVLKDDPANLQYPMPLDAHGKDEVFVGRIRRDFTQDNTLNMWIVADNLRKGAATNAVQIVKSLIEKNKSEALA